MDVREWTPDLVRRHPWETARARFFLRLLADKGALSVPARVLDAGSGDAWFATQLIERAAPGTAVTCWDPAYVRETDCAQEGTRNPALVRCAKRPAGRFDVVLLLDVLEHVHDDKGFLQTLVDENLTPGGLLLASVPAWPFLFSDHDAALGHHRRYRPGDGKRLFAGVGLEPIAAGGLFHALFPARALQLVARRLGWVPELTGAAKWSGGAALTALTELALDCDCLLSRVSSRIGFEVPGLSWWALCRKPHAASRPDPAGTMPSSKAAGTGKA